MDQARCQVFLKAAELRSLTKAAQSLGYTQPGVSQTIKKMEEEYGFKLFFRTRSGVELTSDGRRMLSVVREIAKWNEMLKQTSDAIRGLETGTIRIATYSSIGCYWLPKIIRAFHADYPMVQIETIEGGVQDIMNMINSSEVDFGFLSRQPGQAFEEIVLTDDPIVAVLPLDHPMRNLDVFPLSGLNDPAFILSTMSYDNDCYRVFEEYQRLYGAGLTPNISSSSAFLILSMIENGIGMSVLAELMTTAFRGRIVTKPLDPEFKRTIIIGVPSLAELSPAASKFVSYAQLFVRNL